MACVVLSQLVEGVDYDLDRITGRIRFKSSGSLGPTIDSFQAANGCGVTVDYCVQVGTQFTCDKAIKQCLPCNDDPVANFSAEGADSDRFLFIFREYLPPPLDFGIGDAYGTGFCWSEISLQDAQDC